MTELRDLMLNPHKSNAATAGKGRQAGKTQLQEQRYEASLEPGKLPGARAPAQPGKADLPAWDRPSPPH